MTHTSPAPPPTDTGSPIEQLVALSRYYGSNPEFVLAGGGNTSCKDEQRLWVKGSGSALANIDPSGFVEMDRAPLEALLTSQLSSDVDEREEQFKQAIMKARMHPELGQRPSVECVLHNLLPSRFVVHTHATLVNMITCAQGGEARTRELFGDSAMWVPYVDPGYILARTLYDHFQAYTERTGRAFPPAVIMENHGLIVCGDTPAEIRGNTEKVFEKVHELLKQAADGAPWGEVSRLPADAARALINTIAPALRGLLAEGEALKVVTFDDSDLVLSLAGSARGGEVAGAGPLTPDQIVYCKSFPLWFEATGDEAPAELIERLRGAVAQHTQRTGFAPQVVLVKGLGLFAVGDGFAGADTIRLVYSDAIKVMAGAERLGGIQYLTEHQRRFIEHWEAESYRKKVSAGAGAQGRAVGKVAVVTGAAQGFGLEIAQDLAAQGAHVVLADLNLEGAAQAAAGLVERHGRGRAMAQSMNVTSSQSLADAVHAVVRTYGGCDLFVSNAGVLRAESVKTQSERDFMFVCEVNYKGYFVCVQAIAPVMAVQHAARPEAWSDIIQINSKSGLQGSNRNGAYAGSKFGGIGLTQSFAMELVEDGIKVNSICPGNFFDGPLWSDPDNGLFVQYLRTGKVEGARTIDDVRRAYEKKVPMGRGCTTPDVMKAVYYLMDQEYETGQAVPVTGGQVMLK